MGIDSDRYKEIVAVLRRVACPQAHPLAAELFGILTRQVGRRLRLQAEDRHDVVMDAFTGKLSKIVMGDTLAYARKTLWNAAFDFRAKRDRDAFALSNGDPKSLEFIEGSSGSGALVELFDAAVEEKQFYRWVLREVSKERPEDAALLTLELQACRGTRSVAG